ncbi:hypothetical protein [Faecalimonas sp.]
MTERECYTTKSIELHLFLGQILLKQISPLVSTTDSTSFSEFEKKYKTLISKILDISNKNVFNAPISLDISQKIKYINQDILLLLQKFMCIAKNFSMSLLEWEILFYLQCLLYLETESALSFPSYWIKQVSTSNFIHI